MRGDGTDGRYSTRLSSFKKMQPSTHMTLVFFCGAATFVTGLRGAGGPAQKATNGTGVFITDI